jgi:microcystin degradation protein MlrC
MSVFDCRMINSFPTSRQPMRGFVDRIMAMEGKDGILSISIAHGFPYADVPEIGTRVLVVTDDQKAKATRWPRSWAASCGTCAARGTAVPVDRRGAGPRRRPQRRPRRHRRPVGQCRRRRARRFHLRPARMIERGITERRLGPIWDPVAVRMCFNAGRGHALPAALRRQDGQAQEKVLKAVMHADVRTLDPHWTTQTIAGIHGMLVYDTLFGIDAR